MTVRHTLPTFILLALLLPAGEAAADSLSFVTASSTLRKGKDVSKYHPINLIDDNPATIWCEGAEGTGEREMITITFKRPQKIDRVVVGPTPQSGREVQGVVFSDGTNTVDIDLAGQYVEQAFARPMKSIEYTLTITTVGARNKAAEVDGDTICLAEFMIYHKKKPFGGRTPPSKLRYNKNRDRIVGKWSGEPFGAPEKFFTFALDGTWIWRYEPLMGGKPKKISGEYRFRGNRLLMRKGETGRWSDMRYKHRDVSIAEDQFSAAERDYEAISFNNALGAQIAGEYNNAVF